MPGLSVRLFLAEGTATGIVTAEIGNWTGHAVAGPRTRLSAALSRPELSRTGIYIIYGDSGVGQLPVAYVGEGDDVSSRLKTHASDPSKDFWDRFIVLTSKDHNLTKAHVRYLETEVLKLLREAKKCVVSNGTSPQFDKLPEADVSDMLTYLDQLQLLLPVIGFDLLRQPRVSSPAKPTDDGSAIEFRLVNTNKGINATAREIDGEFVILSSSTGTLFEGPSFKDSVRAIRDQALESGQIAKEGDGHFRVAGNIGFNSPSYASVFLFGTSRNGRTDWLVKGSSQTYGEWKDAQIKATVIPLT